MLLSILADGQLRIYDAFPSGEVNEWARLKVAAELSPDALVRLSLDLAHLAVNGKGLAGPEAATALAPRALPPGRRVEAIPPRLGSRQAPVLELLQAADRPMRARDLALALGVTSVTVSQALLELQKKGLVHKVPPQRWSPGSGPSSAASGSGKRRRQPRVAAVADQLAQGPAPGGERAAALGWPARTVGYALGNLQASGRAGRSDDGRWHLRSG